MDTNKRDYVDVCAIHLRKLDNKECKGCNGVPYPHQVVRLLPEDYIRLTGANREKLEIHRRKMNEQDMEYLHNSIAEERKKHPSIECLLMDSYRYAVLAEIEYWIGDLFTGPAYSDETLENRLLLMQVLAFPEQDKNLVQEIWDGWLDMNDGEIIRLETLEEVMDYVLAEMLDEYIEIHHLSHPYGEYYESNNMPEFTPGRH